MVQHLVLTLLFPPLFLYGLPADLVRRVIRPAWLRAAGAAMVRPVPAAAIFTGADRPVAHARCSTKRRCGTTALHIVQHLVFLATAVVMWWPVLSPVPELPRASYPGQLLYLFLLGIPMSIVGAMITLADSPLYPFYVAAPRVWGLSPLDDQQIGGSDHVGAGRTGVLAGDDGGVVPLVRAGGAGRGRAGRPARGLRAAGRA